MGLLEPLGNFAPVDRDDHWSAGRLDFDPVMTKEDRQKIAAYLDACPVFMSWMEYTTDEIGGRFGVSGGSAIFSDGRFFWRGDAGAYVREYGARVPDGALRHFESVGWVPPAFERDSYVRIYEELKDRLV